MRTSSSGFSNAAVYSQACNFKTQRELLIRCCLEAAFLLKLLSSTEINDILRLIVKEFYNSHRDEVVVLSCSNRFGIKTEETIDVLGDGNMIRDGVITSISDAHFPVYYVGIFVSGFNCFTYDFSQKMNVDAAKNCALFPKKKTGVNTFDLNYLRANEVRLFLFFTTIDNVL